MTSPMRMVAEPVAWRARMIAGGEWSYREYEMTASEDGLWCEVQPLYAASPPPGELSVDALARIIHDAPTPAGVSIGQYIGESCSSDARVMCEAAAQAILSAIGAGHGGEGES